MATSESTIIEDLVKKTEAITRLDIALDELLTASLMCGGYDDGHCPLTEDQYRTIHLFLDVFKPKAIEEMWKQVKA